MNLLKGKKKNKNSKDWFVTLQSSPNKDSKEQSTTDWTVPDNPILPLWSVGERNHLAGDHNSLCAQSRPEKHRDASSRVCHPPDTDRLQQHKSFAWSQAAPNTLTQHNADIQETIT